MVAPAPETLRATCDGLEILANTDLRGRIGCPPALIVHGDRDLLSPLPTAQWLAQPGARLDVFHGAAHAPFLSHPVEFVETVKNYLVTHG
jgi:pimeloyl-[acyl-carrier protein] methyl ester esterase